MPNLLNLRPDDIDTIEKRSNFSVGVIGCGRKGILFAYAFAKAGFKVMCSDADPSVVKKLTKGKTPFKQTEIESKIKNLINSEQLTLQATLRKLFPTATWRLLLLLRKLTTKK